MIDSTIDYLHNVDTFAAVSHLVGQRDPFTVATDFNDLIKYLYWEEKDLPSAIAMGRAGIQYGLSAATEVEQVNPEAAEEIRLKVRALAYNVASFAWPGWDEQGIAPNETNIAFGYDAAKLLIRMCQEMDAEPIKMARAWWLLGGYQLAVGKRARAQQSYDQSAEQAAVSDARSEQLLAQAFSILAQSAQGVARMELSGQFTEVIEALSQEEHGAEFVEQVETASRVFGINL